MLHINFLDSPPKMGVSLENTVRSFSGNGNTANIWNSRIQINPLTSLQNHSRTFELFNNSENHDYLWRKTRCIFKLKLGTFEKYNLKIVLVIIN